MNIESIKKMIFFMKVIGCDVIDKKNNNANNFRKI